MNCFDQAAATQRRVSVSHVAHPIQVLREQASNLKMAINLALADPKPKPVHRLRTTTRRIEALLILLDLLPGLPEYRHESRTARKLLKKVRRAAGSVRDLDVQRDFVLELAESKSPAKTSAHTSDAAAKPDHLDGDLEFRHVFQHHANLLAETLDHHRQREAASLTQTLAKLEPRLAPTLDRLLAALAPAESLTISTAHLAALTHAWYQHQLPTPAKPGAGTTTNSDPKRLHAIRKSAKLARYIAEVASRPAASPMTKRRSDRTSRSLTRSSVSPSKLAAHFEALQQAGGNWHDLFTLARSARHHLGKHSPVTRHLKAARDSALQAYEQQI